MWVWVKTTLVFQNPANTLGLEMFGNPYQLSHGGSNTDPHKVFVRLQIFQVDLMQFQSISAFEDCKTLKMDAENL